MNIIIDNRSDSPIYEQIVSQIKREIAKGHLVPDEALPSMRTLARELGISLITTKRAYEELEREGYLYSQVGKGSFVAAIKPERLQKESREKAEEALKSAVRGAQEAGLDRQDVERIVSDTWKEE